MKNFVDFIVITTGYTNESHEHLGVCYIKSFLEKHGIDSAIHLFFPNEIDKIPSCFGQDPRLVAFPLYAGNSPFVYEAIKNIKQKFHNVHITLGGSSVCRNSIDIMNKNTYIDSIVQGEGEESFLELAQRVFMDESLEGCRGVTYRNEDGNVLNNPSRPLIKDLDILPFPSREIFERFPSTYMRIVGHRGCNGLCSFCDGAGIELKKDDRVRFRSGKNIVDEIESLNKKYDINVFVFVESTFIEDAFPSGLKKVEDIISEIKKRKLDVYLSICTRSENISRDKKSLFKGLVEAGLETILLGIEAGNSYDLELYGKIATIEDNEKAIKIVHDSGINLSYGFIMFNPYTTFERLYQNVDFLHRNKIGHIMMSFLSCLELYPGSPIRKKLIKDGFITKEAGFSTDKYNYTYKHQEISELFESVKLAKVESDELMVWTKLGILQARINRLYKGASFVEFKNIYDKIINLKNEFNEKNCDFFRSCVKMKKENVSKEEIDAFCLAFSQLNSLEPIRNVYWELYAKYARKQHKSGQSAKI